MGLNPAHVYPCACGAYGPDVLVAILTLFYRCVVPAGADLMEEDEETADAPSTKKPRKSAAILEDSDDEDGAGAQAGPPQVLPQQLTLLHVNPVGYSGANVVCACASDSFKAERKKAGCGGWADVRLWTLA